jgi:hypothetical protein
VRGDTLEKACIEASNLIQDAINNAISIGQGQYILNFSSI